MAQKKVSIFLDPGLHKELRLKALNADSNMQKVTEGLIRNYIFSDSQRFATSEADVKIEVFLGKMRKLLKKIVDDEHLFAITTTSILAILSALSKTLIKKVANPPQDGS